jgi:glucose-1-phosphate thymidylyltransferase
MIVSGMTFIYGVDQTRFFQKAMIDKTKTTVLSLPKKKIDSPARIYYDSDKKVVTSEDGEKLRTQYDYYQIPIVFCPAHVIGSMKLEENVGDETIPYTQINDEVYTVALDRGFVEIPLNTWDDVMDASSFIKTVQKACGMQIYCIEEIAWRRGMISHDEFIAFGEQMKDTPYGKYILEIAEAKVNGKSVAD